MIEVRYALITINRVLDFGADGSLGLAFRFVRTELRS